jgi:DNA replication and repair protein RecF
MSLVQLEIHQVRNLNHVEITPSSQINLIYGENASGKTSILEAIHILSLARSFRTNHIQHVIQRDKENLTVFGRIRREDSGQTTAIGIQKGRDQTQIRINNQTINKTSALAAALPVQVINPDIHKLLEQGPRYRRQFLDWGVFHVEHSFLTAWQDYHKVLRQRNAALRTHSRPDDIRYWDPMLVEKGEQISRLRREYIQGLQPYLARYCQKLLGLTPELHYQPGWNQELTLKESLDRGFERDRQQGFTQSGPHRADLVIRHDKHPVQTVFSRGQQKMLVSAMRLAQISHLKETRQQIPVLLVDDLAAELDQAHRAELLGLLVDSGAQLFVTATETGLIDTGPWQNVKMFHVEHGSVREVI